MIQERFPFEFSRCLLKKINQLLNFLSILGFTTGLRMCTEQDYTVLGDGLEWRRGKGILPMADSHIWLHTHLCTCPGQA